MFNTVEKLITTRNLRPKKKEGFLKVISIFSFLGIMLGVATLIIVMSVMNGFRTELTNKILGFNSHITIKPYSDSINDKFYSNLKEEYKDIKIIKTYNGEAVIMMRDTAKGVLIRGIDSNNFNQLDFFQKNIIDGDLNNFTDGTIILGKQLAIELGVVVGDRINIMSSSSMTTLFGAVPKQSNYKIAAVFSSGLYEFDKNIAFFNLEESLSFFEKTTEEINLEIFIKNPLNANKYKDEIHAVMCFAFTNKIPKNVKELDLLSKDAFLQSAQRGQKIGKIAIAYTVWSTKKGGGKLIVKEVFKVIKKFNHLNRLVTLSPLTEMARNFHLRNGAVEVQINETTQNFEYIVLK